jgi:hypothetical protein
MLKTVPILCLAALAAALASDAPRLRWAQHDPARPQPAVISPELCREGAPLLPPPSDASVLFDGHDLSQWTGRGGQPAPWLVRDGYAQVVPHSGSIRTRRGFGDCQLHLECAAPDPPTATGQDRGNSGIKLMGLYEIQVLDSYRNPTYADGIAGAVYGQHPPLVNASCPPGRWESYDIVFHAPRFDAAGALLRPATATVLYNGVLVQDHAIIAGPTSLPPNVPPGVYRPHPSRLPLLLQEHNGPVRFRNIWLRELDPATP